MIVEEQNKEEAVKDFDFRCVSNICINEVSLEVKNPYDMMSFNIK